MQYSISFNNKHRHEDVCLADARATVTELIAMMRRGILPTYIRDHNGRRMSLADLRDAVVAEEVSVDASRARHAKIDRDLFEGRSVKAGVRQELS